MVAVPPVCQCFAAMAVARSLLFPRPMLTIHAHRHRTTILVLVADLPAACRAGAALVASGWRIAVRLADGSEVARRC